MNHRSFLPLAALTLALGLSACGGNRGPGELPLPQQDSIAVRTVPVTVLVVQPAAFADKIELSGTFEAPNDATLSAEAAGRLLYVAELGAFVREGGVVARVDPATANAGLAQARAGVRIAESQLQLARDEFRRQEPLYRDSIITALEFEAIRARVAQGEAQLANAQAVVAQAEEFVRSTTITAPFGGTVETRILERGEMAAPGVPVVRLVASQNVKLRAGVPERFANDVRMGTTVEIQPTAYGLQPLPGTVTFVGSAIDPANRTFPIEVTFNNEGGRLKPAMVAKVLVTRQTVAGALSVPLSAVVRDENGSSLYVAAEEGGHTVARRRAVTLGATAGTQVVVSTGLQAGDRVVVEGQAGLVDGDRLRIQQTRETAPPTQAVAQAN